MDPHPPILSLPDELFNQILTLLPLSSVQSLRLGCRDLRLRCNVPAWYSYFKGQKTDLSNSSLERLYALASYEPLGKLIKSITVQVYPGFRGYTQFKTELTPQVSKTSSPLTQVRWFYSFGVLFHCCATAVHDTPGRWKHDC